MWPLALLLLLAVGTKPHENDCAYMYVSSRTTSGWLDVTGMDAADLNAYSIALINDGMTVHCIAGRRGNTETHYHPDIDDFNFAPLWRYRI
jgi:hypothetical protein